MKKFTKFVSLILVLVLILGTFAACGNKADTPDDSKPANSQGDKAPATNDDGVISAGDVDVNTEFVTASTIDTFVGDVTVYSTNDETEFVRKTPAGTLTIGQNIPIEALDPGKVGDTSGLYLLYDRLVSVDTTTGEIVPSLATAWEWTDDVTLHMTLREDVYFHNGAHMTAEDVMFTLQRLCDPVENTKSIALYKSIDLEKSYIEDDYNIVIVLSAPSASFLSNLGINYAGILCKSYVEEKGNDSFWDAPVGTGPYKLTGISSGDRYEFARNEEYWGEKTNVDTITIRFYSEISTMFIDYENGDIDMAVSISTQDAQRVLDGSVANTNMALYPELRVYTLLMYTLDEYLADPVVREAITYALDETVITNIGYGILSQPATSYLPNGVRYREAFDSVYDPEYAAKLLSDAGYEPGEIVIELGTNTMAAHQAMAEVIQAMLDAVGITVKLSTADMAAHVQRIYGTNNGGVPEVDMGFQVTAVTNLDPDFAYANSLITSSHALAKIHNDEIQALLVEGKTTLDEGRRDEIYGQVQTLVHDNYLAIPMAETLCGVVYRDYVTNITCVDPRAPFLGSVTLAE